MRALSLGDIYLAGLTLLVLSPLALYGVDRPLVIASLAAVVGGAGLTRLIIWFKTATDETEASRWLDDERPSAAESNPIR